MDRKLLAAALADRLDAVIPEGFHVFADVELLCVTGDDPSDFACTGAENVKAALDGVAGFVSETTADVWPPRAAPDAPHPAVQVDESDEGFAVSWRCGEVDVLALPPVAWSEVGGR